MTLLFSRPGRSIPIFRYINTMSFIGYLQLLKKTSCAKMTRFIRNPVCFGMVSSSFRFSFWCVDSYEQKRPGTEDGSMHMWHPQGSWQANKAVWDVWPFWHVFSFLCGSTYQPKYYDLRFCIFLCIEVQSTIWRLTIVGIICFPYRIACVQLFKIETARVDFCCRNIPRSFCSGATRSPIHFQVHQNATGVEAVTLR